MPNYELILDKNGDMVPYSNHHVKVIDRQALGRRIPLVESNGLLELDIMAMYREFASCPRDVATQTGLESWIVTLPEEPKQ